MLHTMQSHVQGASIAGAVLRNYAITHSRSTCSPLATCLPPLEKLERMHSLVVRPENSAWATFTGLPSDSLQYNFTAARPITLVLAVNGHIPTASAAQVHLALMQKGIRAISAL